MAAAPPGNSVGYTLFDTALGRCALAWGTLGLRAVQLPEVDDALTVARMLRVCGPCDAAVPTPEAAHAIDGVRALLSGEPVDLLDVRLDRRRCRHSTNVFMP